MSGDAIILTITKQSHRVNDLNDLIIDLLATSPR